MSAPALRFKEFFEPWEIRKASEILQRVSSPVEVVPDEQYRQIGIRSHGKGIFHKDAVSGASLGDKRVFWVGENLFVLNIVFAWEQAVAKTAASEIGMVASHRFPMYQPKLNQSVTEFILRLFLTDRGKHYLGLASPGGAGRNKTLGQKNFEELDLVVPCVAEQNKIANFLTAVDERLAQLTRKHELLTQYKKGVMQQIFNQELRFKDDDGREFAEWEEKSLGEIASFIKDGTHGTHQDTINGEYLLLSAKNIRNGGIYFDDSDRRISKDEFCSIYKNYKLCDGDVLLSVVGTIGRVAIYSSTFSKVAFQRSVAFFRFEHESSLFIAQLFTATKFQNDLLTNQVVSAQAGIYLGDLAKIRINLPSLEEQTKIANFLTAIDDKITATQTQLAAVKQYKQGLLQQMFV